VHEQHDPAGRHISDNGRTFAEQLEALVAVWPVPVEEIVLVGHSMGGLVARSATHAGVRAGHRWVGLCRRVCCIGTPHRGAPLERFAHRTRAVLGAIDHPGTQIPAEILRIRSAGIRDLYAGTLDDAHWNTLDPDAWRFDEPADVTLLDGVAYAFLVGTLGADPAHPLSQAIGDGMVTPESAGAGGPDVQVHAVGGVGHAVMQTHPEMYALLERFCAEGRLP
jgi:pimeloyl-ACP methyl ester carboxylesterase